MASAFSCIICHDCDRTLRYFHVPTNQERLQAWSELLNLEIKKSSIVCEKHFLEEHFTKNSELNCWRINSRAIPTLHLTDEDIGDYKFINEDDYDKSAIGVCPKKDFRNISTQTKKFQNPKIYAIVHCLWCNDCFDTPDLYEILKHFRSEHRYEIESFLNFAADDDTSKSTFDDMKEDTTDFSANQTVEEIYECSVYNEIDVETNTANENSTMNYSKIEEDDDDEWAFQLEECNIEDEFLTEKNEIDDEQGNIDEILEIETVQTDSKPRINLLENGEEGDIQINIETSDPALIFCIIELLQANPTIWFINGFKSKEYEAGLTNFCQQFSEKYEYFSTQMQLHESLIEIRDWYQSIYAAKTSHLLQYPQNEYFYKLAKFLPDKSDGKTCELCACIFNDHVQYFAHKKLTHAEAMNDNNENVPLKYLKTQANDYFYARYPLRQGGFSYECQVCPTKYGRTGKRVFLDHIKKHLDIRDHVCDICGKSFIKLERFQIHRNRHFGLHKSKCGICGKEFTNFSLLTAHRKRYHRPIEGTIEEILELQRQRKMDKSQIYYVPIEEDNQTIYGCPFCERTYKHKSGVHQHCKLLHKNQFSIKERPRKNKRGISRRAEEEEHSSDTEIDM